MNGNANGPPFIPPGMPIVPCLHDNRRHHCSQPLSTSSTLCSPFPAVLTSWGRITNLVTEQALGKLGRCSLYRKNSIALLVHGKTAVCLSADTGKSNLGAALQAATCLCQGRRSREAGHPLAWVLGGHMAGPPPSQVDLQEAPAFPQDRVNITCRRMSVDGVTRHLTYAGG